VTHATSGSRNLQLALGVIFLLAIVLPLGQYLHSYTSMTVKEVSSSATLSLLRWYSSSTAYTVTPSDSLKQMLKDIDTLNQEIIALRTASIAAGNVTQLTFVEKEFKARWCYSYAHSSLSVADVRDFLSTGRLLPHSKTYFGYTLLSSYNHVYRYLNELHKVSLFLNNGLDMSTIAVGDTAPATSATQKDSSESLKAASTVALTGVTPGTSPSSSLKLPEITYTSTSVQAPERSAFALRKYRKKATTFPEINLVILQSLTDLIYLPLKDPIALSTDSTIQMKLLDNIPYHMLEEVYPDMLVSSVQSQLDFIWKWIKQSRLREHPLTMASLMHFNFQQLHPFVTGNKRASKLLLNLILLKHGLPMIIIRPDLGLAQYELKINIAKERGDLLPLVEFIAEEMLFTLNFIKHLFQGVIDPL
jgi:hypothetical protein